jgi:hypothetical protein
MQLDLRIPTSPAADRSEPSADRPDATAAADPFRRDNDGYRRFRGGPRRGPHGAAKTSDEDLHLAITTLVDAREDLAAAYQLPTSERRQRREAFRAALAKVGLAGRFVDQVVMKHGREPPDCEAL